MAESIISPGVFQRENDISFVQPAPIAAGAAFIGPTVKGPIEIPTVVTSYNNYLRIFGDTFISASTSYEYLTSLAVKNYFSQGGQTALITRVANTATNYSTAANTWISASATTGPLTGSQPFTLATLGRGAMYNSATSSNHPIVSSTTYQNGDGSLISGSVDNIRWEISNINNTLGTFTVSVRQGNDNTNNKTVLETFNNVSLDPNSDNYIASVIGDQVQAFATDGTSYYLNTTGSYPNRSNYIRVSAVNNKTINYLANDGVTVNRDATEASFSGSLPTSQSGSFFSATGTIANGANYFSTINSVNTQGLVGTDYTNAIRLLSNKDDYQFNIIAAPGLTYANTSTQLDSIVSLAESRGDCIAVIDLVNYDSTLAGATTKALSLNTSYGASYWPWIQMRSATGRNEWCPASVVIPGVYAFTDAAAAPWFAPAGLVRGGIPGVIQTERRLSKSDRDNLYAGKVNPIATFPGTGISIMGQKTLQSKASALDRVNVRRLLIDLKKFIGDQARNLVFEQNTISTRNRFLAAVNPYLESVVQRQGLYAYRVVMDDTNNTADVVDRNQLIGQIYIQPAKTIEFVVLDFVIEPTGVTFG
jgi:phage tail sheath protein FI